VKGHLQIGTESTVSPEIPYLPTWIVPTVAPSTDAAVPSTYIDRRMERGRERTSASSVPSLDPTQVFIRFGSDPNGRTPRPCSSGSSCRPLHPSPGAYPAQTLRRCSSHGPRRPISLRLHLLILPFNLTGSPRLCREGPTREAPPPPKKEPSSHPSPRIDPSPCPPVHPSRPTVGLPPAQVARACVCVFLGGECGKGQGKAPPSLRGTSRE